MINKSLVLQIISWIFGIIAFAIGVINTFWGNDMYFGIMLVVLSLVYFPPLNVILKKSTGFTIPGILKILVGLFIIWSSLGVGELFDKIELMMKDLS